MDKLTLVYLHLLAVVVALGGSVFVLFILTPVASRVLPQPDRLKLIAGIIKRFHPILLGCYGILILTGTWLLTGYKISAGVNYFQVYGKILMLKLGLVFLAVMIASYQFFGLGTGIVHMVENNLDLAGVPARLRRLRFAGYVNLFLIAVIVYLGLRLSRI